MQNPHIAALHDEPDSSLLMPLALRQMSQAPCEVETVPVRGGERFHAESVFSAFRR